MKKKIENVPFAFPTPIFIVGTYNEDGTPNAMNAAWAGVCVAKPPCITVSVQRVRKTYDNLMNIKEFTINIPSKKYVKEADYFGLASGSKTNKFEDTKLTPVKAEIVNAPYIQEFPVNIECKVVNITEIGTHVIFIGEIVNVLANEECFNEKGKVTIEKTDAIVYDTINSTYHEVGAGIAKSFSAGKEFFKREKAD